MSVINDVLRAVIEYAQAENPYADIVIGSMPADNGLSIAIGAGGANYTALDKGMSYELNLVLNGKHHNQQTVADTLNDIHQALSQRKEYLNTDEFQITDISTITAPNYIGREPNNQWLYGSSIKVKFYFRKVK